MKIFVRSFFLILLSLLSVIALIFIKPTLVINSASLSFLLKQTEILQKWSWENFSSEIDWKAWNKRRFHGQIQNFCVKYENTSLSLDSCFEHISWDFVVNFNWRQGLYSHSLSPLILQSNQTQLSLMSNQTKANSGPPDLYGNWMKLWNDIIPNFEFKFNRIVLRDGNKERTFDLYLVKNPKLLKGEVLGFKLSANPNSLYIMAPPKLPFPKRIKGMPPMLLRNTIMSSKITQNSLMLDLKGNLEALDFKFKTHLKLPLKASVTSPMVIEEALLNLTGYGQIPGWRKTLKKYAPKPFNILPAPFNSLDGKIITSMRSFKSKTEGNVIFWIENLFDLSGNGQIVNLNIDNEVELNPGSWKIINILVSLGFNQVKLELPRLSKKSAPPQFIPDSRFKTSLSQNDGPKLPLSLHLEANDQKSLHLKTNLLKQTLRFNFDLEIEKGVLKHGHISLLPLKTKIFKRPIDVRQLTFKFSHPNDPIVKGEIKFPLPEYKITLNLEGPIQKPRYAFQSDPPLPQSDIYAVLLFGRPMDDLDSDDKTAAQKTNQVLAQGIFSLSALYFLAGSPVEYVGYDPESQSGKLQLGLGQRTTLQLAGKETGVNNSSVRRSLGKGWYLDTSIQTNSERSTWADSRSYGVLLERIIAY